MKAEGTGYKLIMGFIMVGVCFLLWIPLNEVTGQVGDIFNNMTTDSDTIARNNTGVLIFQSMMLFIFLVFGIWVMKSAMDKKSQAAYT